MPASPERMAVRVLQNDVEEIRRYLGEPFYWPED